MWVCWNETREKTIQIIFVLQHRCWLHTTNTMSELCTNLLFVIWLYESHLFIFGKLMQDWIIGRFFLPHALHTSECCVDVRVTNVMTFSHIAHTHIQDIVIHFHCNYAAINVGWCCLDVIIYFYMAHSVPFWVWFVWNGLCFG